MPRRGPGDRTVASATGGDLAGNAGRRRSRRGRCAWSDESGAGRRIGRRADARRGHRGGRHRDAADAPAAALRMTLLGVVLRWLQLAAALSLVGVFAVVLLAGRSDRPTARAWEARVLRAARWLAVLL